jgi:hypothetical protein
MKKTGIALALLCANFGAAYVLLKGSPSPDLVALLLMGFLPGFMFSSVIFPGIHSDLSEQILAMSFANSAAHYGAYRLFAWFFSWLRSKRKLPPNDTASESRKTPAL